MSNREGCVVLVVEDDASIADFVQAALGDEGYAVVVTPSGEEGLQEVERREPAVILLDMLLPGMDGAAFLGQLRQRRPSGIPVVLMTAARDEPARLGLKTEGLLLKPFELDALLREVERVGGECLERET